jgi:hypothetical protein
VSQDFAIRVDSAALGLDDLGARCDEAVRPAAQAMAQVLYEEVKRNVTSRVKRKTGNLAASIYQAYSTRASSPGHATYHVSWNPRKAPHGHLVEFGHVQRYEITFDPSTMRFTTHRDRPLATPRLVAARPFVRPAMSAFPRAQEAGVKRYFEELQSRGVLS